MDFWVGYAIGLATAFIFIGVVLLY